MSCWIFRICWAPRGSRLSGPRPKSRSPCRNRCTSNGGLAAA
jgi:hypothetical protein